MDTRMFCRKISTQDITIQAIPCANEIDIFSSDDEDDIFVLTNTSPEFASDAVNADSGDEALQNCEASMSSHPQPLEKETLWKIIELNTGAKEIPEQTPIQYFKNFFDDDLLNFIVDQSNFYAVQRNPATPLDLTREELEQFLGTVLFTLVFPLPRSRMYWQTSSRVAHISDIFTWRRWEAIKNFIHFNDDSKVPPKTKKQRDKLFKIRPFINNLLCKFWKIPQEQMLYIDEQIVPFKGISTLKQYNSKKPHKREYKMNSKKFYHRLFFHFIDMVTVNCWMLYRQDAQSLEVPKVRQYDLVGFKTEIAMSLIRQNKDTAKRRERPSSGTDSIETEIVAKKRRGSAAPTPAKDMRKDKYAHWPQPSDRQRCKLPGCKKKSTMKCKKCDVHLCLNKSSNCFYDFHTK